MTRKYTAHKSNCTHELGDKKEATIGDAVMGVGCLIGGALMLTTLMATCIGVCGLIIKFFWSL